MNELGLSSSWVYMVNVQMSMAKYETSLENSGYMFGATRIIVSIACVPHL